jgi:hypothetical protein
MGIHGPISVPDYENELEMVSYTFKLSAHGSRDKRMLETGYRVAVVYLLFRSAFKGFVYSFIPSIGGAIKRILHRVKGEQRDFLLLDELEEAIPYLMDLPGELSKAYVEHVTKNVHSLLRESKIPFSEIRGDDNNDTKFNLLYDFIEAGLPNVTTVVLSQENGLKAIEPYFRVSEGSSNFDQFITTLTGHVTAALNVNEAMVNLFRLQASGMPSDEILDSLVHGGLEETWKPLENTILYSDDHILFFTVIDVHWKDKKRRLTCCTQHESCKIDKAFQAHFTIAKAIKNVFKSGS